MEYLFLTGGSMKHNATQEYVVSSVHMVPQDIPKSCIPSESVQDLILAHDYNKY